MSLQVVVVRGWYSHFWRAGDGWVGLVAAWMSQKALGVRCVAVFGFESAVMPSLRGEFPNDLVKSFGNWTVRDVDRSRVAPATALSIGFVTS